MMKRKKAAWAIAAVLAAVVVASASWVKGYFEKKGYARVPPLVGELTEAVYGLGKVKSNQRYELKVGVFTTLKKLHVKEGDRVRKGQLLMEFDDHVAARAPFAGVVTLISINPGENAAPQSVILRLEDPTDQYIELSLEQESALRVRKGQVARVSFETLRGEVLQGTVTAIFPRQDEFIANISIPDLSSNILSGMTADVSIEIGKIRGTLVPARALRSGMLNVFRDGKIQKVKVDVGLVDGLSAEIRGGALRAGDEVLVPKE